MTFSCLLLHYLQFQKYLFKCLAFDALSGHRKEGLCKPWKAQAEAAWLEEMKPSKDRSGPKQLL